MKVLVCGDREWTDVMAVLRRLKKLPKTAWVIHGGARGADKIAGEVAEILGYTVEEFKADWGRYGRGAGPKRNREMLDQEPDLVIAFHWNLDASKGTADCVKEARKRGIKVEVIEDAKRVSKQMRLHDVAQDMNGE